MPRRLAPLAALLLALAVVLAGCGGGGPSASELPVLDDLALVAERTSAADTARFEMELELAMPGFDTPFSFEASGAFDTPGRKAEMRLDLSSFAQMLGSFAGAVGGGKADLGDPSQWKLDMLMDGDVVYMHVPFLTAELPDGKEWVRADLAQMAQLRGTDLEQFRSLSEGTDPREALEYLRAVTGGLEKVGTEDVRGVATTHYRASIDWQKYLQTVEGAGLDERATGMFDQLQQMAGLTTLPVDVWVDADGLLRRFELTLRMTPPGQTDQLESVVRMELFDYGEPLEITAPALSETVDAASLPGS